MTFDLKTRFLRGQCTLTQYKLSPNPNPLFALTKG